MAKQKPWKPTSWKPKKFRVPKLGKVPKPSTPAKYKLPELGKLPEPGELPAPRIPDEYSLPASAGKAKSPRTTSPVIPGLPPERPGLPGLEPSGKHIPHPYDYPGPETLPDRITRLTRAGTLKGKRFRRRRRADVRVGHKIDAEGFDVGETITSMAVNSSWLSEIFLVATDVGAEVAIEFKDGARCHYPGTSERDYQALAAAASKGKEVWQRFYNRAYFLV